MEAFVSIDDVSPGLVGVTVNTVGASVILRRELDGIGVVVNPTKTVALPPKGYAPTVEDISILDSVDVRIADKGEVTVVGVPIDTDEYAVERATEAVKDRGADFLARCLSNMTDKQAAALNAIESFGRRTS